MKKTLLSLAIMVISLASYTHLQAANPSSIYRPSGQFITNEEGQVDQTKIVINIETGLQNMIGSYSLNLATALPNDEVQQSPDYRYILEVYGNDFNGGNDYLGISDSPYTKVKILSVTKL